MPVPDVRIETIDEPARYSFAQIARACTIAHVLGRGRFVLLEPPTPQ
jgi:hypothetical protein